MYKLTLLVTSSRPDSIMAVIQIISILTVIALLYMSVFATSTGPDPQLELADANNRFAFHLYQTLADDPHRDNIFFSPMSISIALAMTSLGARGNTARQIKDVLKFSTLEESRLHSSFAELNSAIFGANADKYVLRKANRLFGHKGFDLRQEFLADAERYYSSHMASLDFVEDTEVAREFINSWVGRETEDKIRDLLPHGSITGMTQLVLVNAIYFKADWVRQFDKSKTFDQDFHVSKDQVLEVPMMHRKSKFNFAEDITLRCKLIELPYVGQDFSMIVVLPDEIDGIDRLQKHLTNEKLQHLLNNLSNVTVGVAIPKFKLEETLHMNDVLYSMGMRDLFVRDKADLSGITGTRDLFVSSVIHRAFLEVNEEGSEAAAATAVTINKRSISLAPEFIADHPFLFFIADSKTKAIVFMGHCRKPEGVSLNHEEL
ncbi:leukocyte elastase inhibitor-like [Patiria miniata]|uniref:Serpin domain-containing protein n=1 Tax=Patiria miniata TaxID=46514 RepID=A0A913ZFL4_PATMI|nr:leukocyte elastase inhibitor-like [Patiria miniata]